MAKILVTGAAGFIGYHLCKRLLEGGDVVCGLDNLNDAYDVGLKQARLAQLEPFHGSRGPFSFHRLDIGDAPKLDALFADFAPQQVVHLAARAGNRDSLQQPQLFVQSNLNGFLNVLECCRHSQVEHLLYASSSAVYGANTKLPFSARDATNHPTSLYAATKKSNELMAHAYSHLYQLPTTGLRFFTVYGPWYRPDMALFCFTQSILAGRPIEVYNHGQIVRDFTFVDDIVEGIVRHLDQAPEADPNWSGAEPDPSSSHVPYRVKNLSHYQPVRLLELIELLEECLGRKAEKIMHPMQPGDIHRAYADPQELTPHGDGRGTPLREGLERFVQWYRSYYQVGRAA